MRGKATHTGVLFALLYGFKTFLKRTSESRGLYASLSQTLSIWQLRCTLDSRVLSEPPPLQGVCDILKKSHEALRSLLQALLLPLVAVILAVVGVAG